MSLAISLHILAVIIWVGGMFFAYVVLRPVAAGQLEPPARLTLWAACFDRFFIWVWLAVVLLPLTGYWISFAVLGGMANVRLSVHLMQGFAWVMIALFVFLYFVPYRRLKDAVAAGDWPRGGQALNIIRRIVGTNLLLGLLTAVIGIGGRYV
ncbi:MAG: CopD family protein [Chromatiaceae bacterium]|jgi:uncharacterized membrane protein|nr:CopD family protein [Chromatiaceae bacterium]